MITIKKVRVLAMGFEAVEEKPHFEKASYRVSGKIFLSLDEKKKRGCLKLSEIDQEVYSGIDRAVIFPVPNKWGKAGWTFVELGRVREDIFRDALRSAYCHVAPKSLALKYSK